jgi:hypothetical protein
MISRIWSREEMPNEWDIGLVCLLHKKGDVTITEE